MIDSNKLLAAMLVASAALAALSLGCLAAVVFIVSGVVVGLLSAAVMLAIISFLLAKTVWGTLRKAAEDA